MAGLSLALLLVLLVFLVDFLVRLAICVGCGNVFEIPFEEHQRCLRERLPLPKRCEQCRTEQKPAIELRPADPHTYTSASDVKPGRSEEQDMSEIEITCTQCR